MEQEVEKVPHESRSELKAASFEEAIPPEIQRSNRWARGALARGFLSAAQAFDAANLSIIRLLPKTTSMLGIQYLTGDESSLIKRISEWQRKIDLHDIEPTNPSYLKSALSFALFNTGYILPVIGAGMSAMLLKSAFAAIIVAGLVNTHATMGEAFIQTSKKHTGNKIDQDEVVDKVIASEDFNKAANTHVLIKGGVCLGFTIAAGPIARTMGGFTHGAIQSLQRTPLGSLMTEKIVSSAHKSVVRSSHKQFGKVFANVADGSTASKMATLLSRLKNVSIALTGGTLARVFTRNSDKEPSVDEQSSNKNDKPELTKEDDRYICKITPYI